MPIMQWHTYVPELYTFLNECWGEELIPTGGFAGILLDTYTMR